MRAMSVNDVCEVLTQQAFGDALNKSADLNSAPRSLGKLLQRLAAQLSIQESNN
jgi:hypothetical protein